MARLLVTFDGSTEGNGAPLVTHNERLADPLDPFTMAIARISKMRNKSEVQHLEIARLEHAGGLYHDGVYEWLNSHMDGKMPSISDFVSDLDSQPEIGPYVPGWNLLRCLQEAGKKHKLGKAVVAGITPVTLKPALQYDGPRDVDGLWFDGRFALRKSVGVQRSRTMRTRPIFTEWRIEAEFELDLTVLDPEKVDQLAQAAGKYEGLCEMRPVYGRFTGSAKLIGAEKKTTTKKEAVTA